MKTRLADLLAALVFAGILTCWAPGYWPVALVQAGAFLLLACVLVAGRPVLTEFVALPVVGLVAWGVWQLAAGASVYRFETGKSVLYWAANAAVFLYVNVLTGEEYGQRRHLSNAWRTASIITAASAIADSPWLGNGSQANSFELQSRYDSIFAERAGVRYRGRQTDTSTFSPHSQILQAWFEAGIFGAAFFLYLGWKLIRAAQWCIFRRRLDALSALFAFCLLRAIWHLAFSPFAGLARLDVALAAVIVVVMDLERRSHRPGLAV